MTERNGMIAGDEYLVRVVDLPPSVPALVALDEDGFANIYVNAHLSRAEQRRALAHELGHLLRDDAYAERDIRAAEDAPERAFLAMQGEGVEETLPATQGEGTEDAFPEAQGDGAEETLPAMQGEGAEDAFPEAQGDGAEENPPKMWKESAKALELSPASVVQWTVEPEASKDFDGMSKESTNPAVENDGVSEESTKSAGIIDGMSKESTNPTGVIDDASEKSTKPAVENNGVSGKSANPTTVIDGMSKESTNPTGLIDGMSKESTNPTTVIDDMSEESEGMPCAAPALLTLTGEALGPGDAVFAAGDLTALGPGLYLPGGRAMARCRWAFDAMIPALMAACDRPDLLRGGPVMPRETVDAWLRPGLLPEAVTLLAFVPLGRGESRSVAAVCCHASGPVRGVIYLDGRGAPMGGVTWFTLPDGVRVAVRCAPGPGGARLAAVARSVGRGWMRI